MVLGAWPGLLSAAAGCHRSVGSPLVRVRNFGVVQQVEAAPCNGCEEQMKTPRWSCVLWVRQLGSEQLLGPCSVLRLEKEILLVQPLLLLEVPLKYFC